METSTDLSAWLPAAGGDVDDQAGHLKYTFPTPLGAEKFARLKVTGP